MNIDTNILIAYLKNEPEVVSFVDASRKNGSYLFISVIVETELLSFENWTDLERILVKQFLSQNFIIVPFGRDLVDIVSEVRTNSRIKLPDAIIAATALHTGTSLLTRNLKDFKKVKGLKVLTV
jgi:predicted nucleic acid-binding protein